jgi:hypothetical protein
MNYDLPKISSMNSIERERLTKIHTKSYSENVHIVVLSGVKDKRTLYFFFHHEH